MIFNVTDSVGDADDLQKHRPAYNWCADATNKRQNGLREGHLYVWLHDSLAYEKCKENAANQAYPGDDYQQL